MKKILKKKLQLITILSLSAFLLVSFTAATLKMQMTSLLVPENFRPVDVGGLSFWIYNSANDPVGYITTGGSDTGGTVEWDGDDAGLYPRIGVQYSAAYRSDQFGNKLNDSLITNTMRKVVYNGVAYFEHDFYQTVDMLVRTYVKPPVRKAVSIPLSPMVHKSVTHGTGTRVFLGDVDQLLQNYVPAWNVESRLVVVQDVGAWTNPILGPESCITAALEPCYFPNVNAMASNVDTADESVIKIQNTYSNQYVKVVPSLTMTTRSTIDGFTGYTYYFNTTLPDGTPATIKVDSTGINTGILEGIGTNDDQSQKGLVPNTFPSNYMIAGGTGDLSEDMDTRDIADDDSISNLESRQIVSGSTYANGYVEFDHFGSPIISGGQPIPFGLTFTQPPNYFPNLAHPDTNYDMASSLTVTGSFGMQPQTTIVEANTKVGWSGYYWCGYYWDPVQPTAFEAPKEVMIQYPVYCNLENVYSLSKMTFLTAIVTRDDLSAVNMVDGKPIDISSITDNYMTSIMKNPTDDNVAFSYKVPTPPDLWGQISAWFTGLFSSFGPILSVVVVIVIIVLVLWFVGKLGGGLKSFVGLFRKSK